MTLPEFLAALEKTPRDGWTTRAVCDGAIRRNLRHGPLGIFDCPISAVAGIGNCGSPEDAARKIGLDEGTCKAIIHAADERPEHDTELRAQLLKACGLA